MGTADTSIINQADLNDELDLQAVLEKGTERLRKQREESELPPRLTPLPPGPITFER
jgi:hypothetical protein